MREVRDDRSVTQNVSLELVDIFLSSVLDRSD